MKLIKVRTQAGYEVEIDIKQEEFDRWRNVYLRIKDLDIDSNKQAELIAAIQSWSWAKALLSGEES